MAEPPNQPAPGTPRWVKVSALVALIVLILFVVALVVGGGEHGPGRHASRNHSGPPLGATHTYTQP
jgi:hypothetical protein